MHGLILAKPNDDSRPLKGEATDSPQTTHIMWEGGIPNCDCDCPCLGLSCVDMSELATIQFGMIQSAGRDYYWSFKSPIRSDRRYSLCFLRSPSAATRFSGRCKPLQECSRIERMPMGKMPVCASPRLLRLLRGGDRGPFGGIT
jgi:hypothetical protein